MRNVFSYVLFPSVSFSFSFFFQVSCFFTRVPNFTTLHFTNDVLALMIFKKMGFSLNVKVYAYFLAVFVSSPEPKAPGELIGWDSSQRPCVRLCVRSHIQT